MKKLKDILKYVLLPFSLLVAGIAYLFGRISELKSQVARQKVEKELGESIERAENAKKKSDSAVADWREYVADLRKSERDD